MIVYLIKTSKNLNVQQNRITKEVTFYLVKQ